MKQRWICLVVLLAATLACSLPGSAALTATRPAGVTPPAQSSPVPPTAVPTASAPVGTGVAAAPTQPPAAVPEEPQPFSTIQMTSWSPATYQGVDPALPLDLAQAANLQVVSGLAAAQKAFLAQNGFTVLHSQEEQFSDIRRQVATLDGQPYFLTTDAAYHALHLDFDELLKTLEGVALQPKMTAILNGSADWLRTQIPTIQDAALQQEAHQALAYLEVAQQLFDPSFNPDADLAAEVKAQVDQIMAGGGKGYSVLFPDFQDDYGAYKPVGHYAGDPTLEAYFRGMTWLGRVNFKLKAAPPALPSRVPLIVTLALNQSGEIDDWMQVNDVLTFLVGPSDDGGPVEYGALMQTVYGSQAGMASLARADLWQQFQAMSGQLPKPRINSTFAPFAADLAGEAGFRFLGQRFTLDSNVLQMLVYDNVKELNGKRRELPTGLDVMAALGSAPALEALQKRGDTAYPGYQQNLAALQQNFQALTGQDWQSHATGAWLQAFTADVAKKDASYPGTMRTSAWGYHELNSALGSWAELKHDTALYTKMPEGFGGGGPPMSPAAPSYVEADPLVFYRLAFAAQSIADGLTLRGMDTGDALPGTDGALRLSDLVQGIKRLGDTLQSFGDMAAKELAGQPLTVNDYYQITDCLGTVECLRLHNLLMGQAQPMPPVPIAAAVAGGNDSVLEAATGKVDRIYVVVSIEGKLQIAQGGVFAYTELVQPRADRLTDQQWQAKVAAAGITLPDWTANFTLPGGKPVRWLAFRVGDVYIVNHAGDQLNVRASSSKQAAVVSVLKEGDYVEIAGGPVQADGQTWWQVKLPYHDGTIGWIVENRAWLDRAWGQ
jgi:hypothetical protein